MLPDFSTLSPEKLHLSRCQVDVSFPPGYKSGPQPHCPWYAECHGRPQIVEVKDTGWEIYHFPSVDDARRFVELTRQRVAEGSFASGRLPPRSAVRIQLRATVDVACDVEIETD
jgi:hypothetical protein